MPEITAVLWQLRISLLWIQLSRPLICLIIGECFGENILFLEVLRYLWISQTMVQVCKWPNRLPGKGKSLRLVGAVALGLQVPQEAEWLRGFTS